MARTKYDTTDPNYFPPDWKPLRKDPNLPLTFDNWDQSNVPDSYKGVRRDPPAEHRRRGADVVKSELFDLHVDMLRAQPGVWVCVRHSVKNGQYAAKPFKQRGCDILIYAALPPDEGYDVYARIPVAEPTWTPDGRQPIASMRGDVLAPSEPARPQVEYLPDGSMKF